MLLYAALSVIWWTHINVARNSVYGFIDTTSLNTARVEGCSAVCHNADMRALQLCLGVLSCLVIIGWSGGNRLVGTWVSDGVGPNSIKDTMITFNANNTYSTKNSLRGRRVTMSGTYALKGKKLTMTLRKISGLPAKFQKLNDKRLAKSPTSDTSTLEWKSDTEVVMVSTTGRSILRKRA